MMIIKFFDFNLVFRIFIKSHRILFLLYLPGNFISFCIMFKCNWKVTTFIKFTKCRRFAVTNTCCFCWWWFINLEWFFKKISITKVRINTLAFFKRDFTVKPSVTKGPVCRNRAFVSRRGDVAVAIICCWVLESVSILHKWHTLSFFSLLFVDNDH